MQRSTSIMDAFERGFQEKVTKVTAVEESDPDSAEEDKKKDEERRSKRRKRVGGRSKEPPQKPAPLQFNVRHVVPTERVTDTNFPEINSVEAEFDMSTRSQDLVVAETNFFNNKNKGSWQQNPGHVLRPWEYLKVRNMLQCPPSEQSNIHAKEIDQIRAVVAVMTREYEEEMLREPVGSERPCLNDEKCEGRLMASGHSEGFTLRECLLPAELKKYEATGKHKPDRNFCLMCKRNDIMRGLIDTRAKNLAVRVVSAFQDYRNLVDVPGEYCLQNCIVTCPEHYEGLTDPIVMHIRSHYRPIVKNGIRYYEQWRMPYPSPTQHFLFPAPGN